jgi:DNA-directed RNA polymerase subunit RPC12/RpoP
MPRRVTVVRCPRCGSTQAGEAGGTYEFTEMRCAACGHSALCDEYQIRDDWNVTIELADGTTALPEKVPVD